MLLRLVLFSFRLPAFNLRTRGCVRNILLHRAGQVSLVFRDKFPKKLHAIGGDKERKRANLSTGITPASVGGSSVM